MAEVNLQQIHDHLLEISFEAGRMIRAANPNSITTGTKLNCMASFLHDLSEMREPR